MGERYTREQHVALDELARVASLQANLVLDRTPAILRAHAAGLSYAEIGKALGMTRQAVHYHASRKLTNVQGGKGK